MLAHVPRAERSLHRQRSPMPRLAAALIGGTVWKMAGLNSNESRTRFAPTARRPDASSSHPKCAVMTAAAPTTPNGRTLSAAGSKVSVARAAKRPKSPVTHGRASSGASRSRSGQTSRVAASSVNDAVPPGSWTSVRHAWCPPSTSVGDQSDGLSRLAIANTAAPGMTPGATPTSDSAASCAPKVNRLPDPAPLAVLTPCASPVGTGAGGSGCGLGDDALAAARFASLLSELTAPAAGTPPAFDALPLVGLSTEVWSRVTAMINATASAASVQVRAGTCRIDGFVSELVSVTSAVTAPDAATETWTRIDNPLPSATKRTRGERARTRAIRSAGFVQFGSASTWRFADATGTLGSAVAIGSSAANANAAGRSEMRRALVLINPNRSIAE